MITYTTGRPASKWLDWTSWAAPADVPQAMFVSRLFFRIGRLSSQHLLAFVTLGGTLIDTVLSQLTVSIKNAAASTCQTSTCDGTVSQGGGHGTRTRNPLRGTCTPNRPLTNSLTLQIESR